MQNIIQIADVADAACIQAQRRLRNIVGQALGRAYPTVIWYVTVPPDASIVQFYAHGITAQYGMTLHATNDTGELERKAVRLAGEYLERFNVSRVSPDASHLDKGPRGGSRNERKGEL